MGSGPPRILVLMLLGSLGLLSPRAPAQTYLFNKANFPTGQTPVSLAAGDFNKDGNVDLAVANKLDNTISVLLGKSDGTFQPRVNYPTGTSPVSVVVGYFNADRQLDLAVANAADNTVSIFLGQSDGTFTKFATDFATGSQPSSIAVGDFNGDSIADLAVTNSNCDVSLCGAGSVSILLGNGDGTFRQPHAPFQVGQRPVSVVVADFNGDNRLDLAVANQQDNTASVLIGNVDGTFQPATVIATGGAPSSVAAGDFNGDGRLDLAVVNQNDNTVSVLLANVIGDGTFGPKTDFTTGSQPVYVITADLNADGRPDLAVANQKDGTVSVMLNNGFGAFATHTDYAAASSPASLLALESSGSAKVNLAIANSASDTVSVLLGNGNGTFSPRADYPAGNGPLSLAAMDLNLDGQLDVAVVNGPDNKVSVLLGNGDGSFQPPKPYSAGAGPVAVVAEHFNANIDQNLDLAVVNQQGNTVSILLGNGDGTFKLPIDFPTGNQPSAIALGRFNADPFLDLAVTNSNCAALPCRPGSVSILLGKGDGTFQPPATYAVGTRPVSVVAADFNGDSNLDLAVANSNDNSVSVLLGKGDGTFAPNGAFATGNAPASVTAGDFNRDGKLDLAVANHADNTISILLGSGDGKFQSPHNFPTGAGPSALIAGDFNGDAIVDLAVTNSDCLAAPCGHGSFSVLLGNPDGTFQARSDYTTGANPTSIAGGSFTGTGQQNLVTANRDENSVSVYAIAPFLVFNPAALDFGTVAVGKTSPAQSVTQSNPGSVKVSIGAITVSGTNSADFVAGATCANSTLNPAASCTIPVTFTPSTAGFRTATLSINDSVPGSPQTVPLAGTGGLPVASLSTTGVDFGAQRVGSIAIQSVTLGNTGNVDLSVPAVAIGGLNTGDFAVTNNSCSLVKAGASCTIQVTFTPAAIGIRSGILTITDNAADGSQAVSLNGIGAGAIVSLSAISLDFGGQIVGTSSGPQAVTLGNSGNAILMLGDITIGGASSADFTQTDDCGLSLKVGASCTINFTFTPRTANSRTATLTIAADALGPHAINLSGSGQDFSISASVPAATITAGQAATYTLKVAPAGGFNQQVSLGCAGIPQLSSCSIAPNPVRLDGSIASIVTVTVTTSTGPSTSSVPWSLPPPFGSSSKLPWVLWFAGLTALACAVKLTRRPPWLGPASVSLLVLFWAACTGGGVRSRGSGTPAGTYLVTVNGTYTVGSVALQHSATLMLNVN